MRLAVTRPHEDAQKLTQGLVAQGHEVVAAPLMTIQFLSPPPLLQRHWQALLITSANALKALAKHPELGALKTIACCCVGPASARLAADLGFADIRVAGGGLKELEALARRELRPESGPLLYLSGEQISGDLVGDLAKSGFETVRVVLYCAVPETQLRQAIVQDIGQGRLDGVLLYSPRTARIWQALVDRHGLSSTASSVLHYCLSANVAAALPEHVLVKIAEYPEDAAMLALTGQETQT
jgi:uroporphyrinogen-III synthase